MTRVSYVYFFILIFGSPVAIFSIKDGKSILDNIIKTVNHAKTYFDIAKDVTNLVTQSLNIKNKQASLEMKSFKTDNEHSFLKHSFIDGFFRMLKLDSPKIIAIAVNSVIFLAQLISTLFDMKPNENTLSEEPETKTFLPNWDPLKFIMEHKNEKVQRLVRQAQDPDLPNQLVRHTKGFDTSCVQLLLCKTSPIIQAAQKSLKNKSVFKNRKMTAWLPSWNEFESNADHCEDQHTECDLFPD